MKEEEIRPQKLFEKYIELGERDIEKFFYNTKLIPIKCPVCDTNSEFVFYKSGFNYKECQECRTLYLSPRPEKEAFDKYYSDSESSKFWANEFYKETEKARREKIWKPKAELVFKKICEKGIKSIVDIGGGYGIFIEEFIKINKEINTLIIEPSTQLAEICQKKDINVICDFFEDINPQYLPTDKTLFTSFELFEHLHDPKSFLEILFKSMKKDDLFLFTTLSGVGIDIQVLWDKSKSVSPPHHLNFFNPKSIKILLEMVGFKTLEITTPGKIDLDIMSNNKNDIKDKFWKTFLEYSSDQEKENMQKYISENLLSSHMMVICQK